MNKKDYEKRLNRKLKIGIILCIIGIFIFIVSMFIIAFPTGSLSQVIFTYFHIAFPIFLSVIIILAGIIVLKNWEKENCYYLNNKNQKK